MIPCLSEIDSTQKHYLDFLDALEDAGFAGDLNPDYGNRVVLSTDNSIYQVLPQGVIYPKSADDLVLIMRLAGKERFNQVRVTARGGGTGTNGQSLTDGLVIDISKHMNGILEINVDERWARVQAGVVKDQLNSALKPYGLFFAPELSTSNRATIGGMISTDASGQGSILYGKTRDHVLELKSILLGGGVWNSAPLSDDQFTEICCRDDQIGTIHRILDQIYCDNREQIDNRFPVLNRCLTGYDLAHIRDEQGRFNLNSILCGAEGSLGFVAEAKLNLLPIPKFSALINIKYDSFESSLRDAKALMEWGPTSIETIDSKVLNLAMQDIVWESVRDYFPQNQKEAAICGINLVEYTGDDEQQLRRRVDKLTNYLKQVSGKTGKCFGYSTVYGAGEIDKIWAMRKKAVGLLGNTQGEKRPIPFVEDTAVPPESLADYIMEFRQLLDEANLQYGMFGHVDVGVLHVRPAIDMKDEQQARQIRTITDQVVKLTQKYRGLLWGEHGKGVRSEYAPEFFGELYPELQKIKALFDPHNQLNPGKIATPLGWEESLLKIDKVPTRGQHDRQIAPAVRDEFTEAMFCNGNGACYNYDPRDVMCPSWKATRQRIHSPKGRSSLVREWLRLLSCKGVDLAAESRLVKKNSFIVTLPGRIRNSLSRRNGSYDFSHEVHVAMMGCLACKSCAGQCPIKVNVPDFRARFLELYYGRYLRPVKDYIVGGLEFMIPWLARFPAPYNWAVGNRIIAKLMRRYLGMVNSPAISTHTLKGGLEQRTLPLASIEAIESLTQNERDTAVIIVQDAFTSYFESQLVLDLVDLLRKLDFTVLVAPYRPNGKPLHIHGFLQAFENTARRNAQMLAELATTGVPLVGIDPSITLTYREEYRKIKDAEVVNVMLIQEWLAQQCEILTIHGKKLLPHHFKLLAHCSERTSAVQTIRDWQQIFQALGQQLEMLTTGCCGMAGTFGHEADNLETSKKIYQLSWSEVINDPDNRGILVATGYSCRSQVKRLDNQQIPHPVQVLNNLL
jgi:FAD/FMN-containing dehydrogenase/Fe-S oxidoreductase